jgi:hypothetical protein
MWNSAWIPQKGGVDVDELVRYDVLSDLGRHTTLLDKKNRFVLSSTPHRRVMLCPLPLEMFPPQIILFCRVFSPSGMFGPLSS